MFLFEFFIINILQQQQQNEMKFNDYDDHHVFCVTLNVGSKKIKEFFFVVFSF